MEAPNNIECEQMVLGCALQSVNALNEACDCLDIIDFYDNRHRIIFSCMKELKKDDKSIDSFILQKFLRERNLFEEVGGAYLMELELFSGVSHNFSDYINDVKELSLLRQVIVFARTLEREAHSVKQKIPEFIDQHQKKFLSLDSNIKNKNSDKFFKSFFDGEFSPTKTPYLKEIEERQTNFKKFGNDYVSNRGLKTHFPELDRKLQGFQPGQFIVLAARPAVGKTALGLNIIENMIFKDKRKIGFFSLEMTAYDIGERIISAHLGINSKSLAVGDIGGLTFQAIYNMYMSSYESDLFVDDQPGLKINEIKSRARRWKSAYDIDMIVIDYLQFINSSEKAENRQVEVAKISKELSMLAKELNIPIFCLAQLSREVDKRESHRPIMSDLRESGGIEQDADVVLFLMRPDFYNPDNKPGHAKIIIGKNRKGEGGDVDLDFEGKFFKFLPARGINEVTTECNDKDFEYFKPKE